MKYELDTSQLGPVPRGFRELDGGGNTGFDRRDYLGKVRWQSKAAARVQQSVQVGDEWVFKLLVALVACTR